MSKLSIRIERWGKALIYQVLQQDELITTSFKASNNIEIVSKSSPSLVYITTGKLCIRGDNEELNNFISVRYFETEELAENFRLKVLEAVEEFNSHVDWSKVPVDTKVLVSDDGKDWNKRYFSDYEDDKCYCFLEGGTSWSSNGISIWKYCKLAE